MSSKIITTVIVVMIVGPFGYIATADAVSITQNLQEQTVHIQQLNTEYVQLDRELEKTEEVKKQVVAEVQRLETEAQSAIAERKKLETELGAN